MGALSGPSRTAWSIGTPTRALGEGQGPGRPHHPCQHLLLQAEGLGRRPGRLRSRCRQAAWWIGAAHSNPQRLLRACWGRAAVVKGRLLLIQAIDCILDPA